MVQGKVIYLDFDGVIVDNSSKLYAIYKDLLLENARLSKEEYWNLKKEHVSEEEIVRKTIQDNELVNEFVSTRIDFIVDEGYLGYDKLFDGVIEFISGLRKDNKVVLVTRRQNKEHLFNQLKALGILGLFDDVLVGDCDKDEMIKFHKFFNKDAMIIGDTETDIEAGKMLGIFTVAVLSGIRSREYLERYEPDLIVESLVELK